MHTTGLRPKLVVSADGRGVVSHAGSRLLADLADATGLSVGFTDALRRLRPRGTGHDPGRVADGPGGDARRRRRGHRRLGSPARPARVFGPVASTPTAWRVLAEIDTAVLAALRAAKLSLTAIDLLAWTRTLLLDGELADAEPKKLRYRLLHAAARITRGARRLHLRIAETWPWRHELTDAFARLAVLPRPAT